MVEVAALVSGGVPWDVAMNMKRSHRIAFIVLLGEARGGEFDWFTMSWKDNKDG
ncbi:hypothetical protein K6L44_07150 [Gluconacetobacter entanii]|uniref:hypothetical protein n=1 Tax=Gluconacetobacter entanii TaxID=108528 RepID=UPI001C935526|nr:hypothetical protein [Gluconacetobacter entanii]MBY4639772.1 hypothetical protein [Gluconacetobacter entanii]MCW4579488.1 hypothetical protein [Gluconacetobacter entanii]MCW4582859.1 hypothetical protein [Gluconacetobacter entanii]MCW4586290.1 hypothetical protein [Gluconacetobacter entanii]